jgi:hypothetical protein
MESNHQINDIVKINLFLSGVIENCIIHAIKFNEDKVKYDIFIPIGKNQLTLFENVDSAFVEK